MNTMNMMMTTTCSTTTLAMSSPINTRPPHIVSSCNCNYNRRKGLLRLISCEVAVKSNNSTTSLELDNNNPSLESASSDEEEEEAEAKIGSRIKVKVPLKVYHVPRVPELDLTGMEGVLKQYVVNWKGKRISANLPYKVQFITQIEGRGPVKFFAHLKEDEFDYLD